MKENIQIAAVLAVTCALGFLLYTRLTAVAEECDARGGVLVRGVAGFECIRAERAK